MKLRQLSGHMRPKQVRQAHWLNMEMASKENSTERESDLLWALGCSGCWRQMLVQRTFPRRHFDFVIF